MNRLELCTLAAVIILASTVLFEAGVITGLTLPKILYVRSEVPGASFDVVQTSTNANQSMLIAKKLLHIYSSSHKYYDDIYDCDQMAGDFWDMLMWAGIPAKIVVGNVNRSMESISDINHAWTIAEVAQGKWLALDPTSGTVHYAADDPLYYRGVVFNNPAAMQNFIFYTTHDELECLNITPVTLPGEGP